MQAFVDGESVSTASGGTLDAQVKAANGRHKLTIKARDSAGAVFASSIDFTVVSPSPVPATSKLSMNVAPAQATITLGRSAVFTLAVATDGSLTQPLAFACSGLPAGVHCAFDPVKIKAAKLPANIKLTIFTSPVTSAFITVTRFMWVAMLLPALVVLRFTKGKEQRRRRLGFIAVAIFMSAMIVGCQGLITPNNHGSFAVTVTGSSTEAQSSSTINLTLN
jgi:hypothetical protein